MRLCLLAALITIPVLVGVQPANALSANERFTVTFYEDFLQRPPTDDEMTWWDAYLGGGRTRTAMATSLFNGDEFANLFAIGSRFFYLQEVDPEDPTLVTDVASLSASGNFVAAEVAVIASATYFSNAGSTNTGFVEAVFHDVLLRPADASGLAYWVGRLDAGTSTRSSLASTVIRSSESAGRRVAGTPGAASCASTELTDVDALASGSYCLVLDRLADPAGRSYWSAQLAGSGQLPTLWASLAASTEYFNHAQS